MQIVVPDEFKPLYVTDGSHPILKIPAEALYKKAAAIERFTKRHQLLGENMLRIMREAKGIGLAGPQIGIMERVIVMSPDNRQTVMFNPRIVKAEGSQIGEEGCLSIPGLYGDVERAEFVEVEALDRKGRESTWELEGLAARVVQHEIDHLEGVLFIDKVDAATLYWQQPTPDKRTE